jgi:BirA family biotin operon repressor/biotin-[acetyl-CoA-carboxylase] ligase
MGLAAFQRLELATVDSTNTHAKSLAASGAPEGTLVFAHEQTAGRGRQGNTWQGISGNLFATLVLRPALSGAALGQLSFVVAVALARAIAQLLPDPKDVGLKWPNDILLRGRKCAGILLESEGRLADGALPWVVAGFGVNLAAGPEGASTLPEAGAPRIKPAEFLDIFEPAFIGVYNEWQEQGFKPIQAAWMGAAVNLGRNIHVRLTRESLDGVFEGIDAQGALQLRLADGGIRHISSGEVYL